LGSGVRVERAVSLHVFRQGARGVHGSIILGTVAGVVEVAVFGLPIHGFDGHVNDPVGRKVARLVIDPRCGFVPAGYSTADDPIPGHRQPEGDAIQGRD
jgi:hypothetical protein